MLGPFTIIEERAQAIGGADAEVVRAFRADLQILIEILVVDDLRATRTLDPEALRNPTRLLRRLDGLLGLLEPGHERRLLRPRHVITRPAVHRPDLSDQVVHCLITGIEPELRGLHDEERRGGVVKEQVLVGLVELAEVIGISS